MFSFGVFGPTLQTSNFLFICFYIWTLTKHVCGAAMNISFLVILWHFFLSKSISLDLLLLANIWVSLGNWYTLFQVNWNCISRLNVLQLDLRFIDCIKRLVSPGLGLLSGENLGLRYVAIKKRHWEIFDFWLAHLYSLWLASWHHYDNKLFVAGVTQHYHFVMTQGLFRDLSAQQTHWASCSKSCLRTKQLPIAMNNVLTHQLLPTFIGTL